MTSLPLTLRIHGKRAVVVGGGPVAERRALAWRAAGADVVVVSPEVTDSLSAAAHRGDLTWLPRGYQVSDLDGAWLVQTATNNADVDAAVLADADIRQIWCLKGGDPESSSAWAPAVARADDVTIAVSGGGDARRAATLRDAVAGALDSGDLPLRHRTHHPAGFVALVGGGPGDPDLITARGRRLIAQADVVVYDRLAPQSVLVDLDPDVELIDVGKRPDRHPVPQDEINVILVDRASRGLIVVRLKGGDPYVFGRGGEELLACRAAGVEVEVVPGVTSAIAVAAAAGIPVTHRGVAQGFTVVTGHEELHDVPTRGDHTLILLMGVKRLAASVQQLLTAGHDPATPAAIVESGWTPNQRTTRGTLATIADLATEVGAKAPAIVVIGDAVNALDPRFAR